MQSLNTSTRENYFDLTKAYLNLQQDYLTNSTEGRQGYQDSSICQESEFPLRYDYGRRSKLQKLNPVENFDFETASGGDSCSEQMFIKNDFPIDIEDMDANNSIESFENTDTVVGELEETTIFEKKQSIMKI